ncbi:30S ribosomal protein S16 [Patescibacteria group bacterium]|nr:30S ribosomal protein S16 [Patescibacteria group bacterium]
MLVLRLQRTGKRNDPTFRIVAAEKRRAVKGKFLEVIGHYLPTRNPTIFVCDQERVSHWVSKGAQPSNTLARLLTKEGMQGLESFIDTYTKKKKRNEEEAPAEPATTPAAAPVAETKAASTETVVEDKTVVEEAPNAQESDPEPKAEDTSEAETPPAVEEEKPKEEEVKKEE